VIFVVNKRLYSGEGEPIYRGASPLGNPFTHLNNSKYAEFKVKTRRESIDKYEEWLEGQPEDSDAKVELYRLARMYKDTGELTLICFCAPYECHGNIISRMIHNIVDIGK
jgi:hypothetical protein